jgi:MFS family permease
VVTPSSLMNPPRQAVRNYAIVTAAYWADTLADGAIRMLVLFYFYELGYGALQVASLFLFYEFFGIVTNLCGGYLASRFGLKSTLFMGLGTQLAALAMLALLPAGLLTVAWVMVSQALSGIAKDLTKMSSKSAVKLIAGDGAGRLYRWVALLTGSKNALKGIGFFAGSLLLSLVGFQPAVWVIAAVVALALAAAIMMLRGGLGEANPKVRFRHLLSRNRSVNLLSVARLFLFGARDVWFVVALPVFLSSVLGWEFWQAGGFMALWVIGYGGVQAAAPAILRGSDPTGSPASRLAFLLALGPAAIAMALHGGAPAAPVVIAGLVAFGLLFALNSAVHSYLILAYTDRDKVALNVGIYYMANACGRLGGTLLSGWLYQLGATTGDAGGLVLCLVASSVLLAASGAVSLALPRRGAVQAAS